jgi:hypothetical protein
MNKKILLLTLLAAAPLAADAQSYRCLGADGRRYYGQTIPPECQRRPVEQLNKQGMVVKRIDREREEKERLAKEAADARKREQETASRELARRNHAILATYTSERDADAARERALAENAQAIRDVETRIEAIRKRQSGYDKELALYKDQGEPPAKLRDDVKNAQDELKAQLHLLETKKRESAAINARYDDDKKRYIAISKQR